MLILASISVFLISSAALRSAIFALQRCVGIPEWTFSLSTMTPSMSDGVGHRAALLLVDLDVVEVDEVAFAASSRRPRDRLDRDLAELSRLNETTFEAIEVTAIRVRSSRVVERDRLADLRRGARGPSAIAMW